MIVLFNLAVKTSRWLLTIMLTFSLLMGSSAASLIPASPGTASTPVAQAATVNQPFSWDNATVYFVMTDRFVNGNPSNDTPFGRKKVDSSGYNIGTFHGGDMKGLTLKLRDGYFTRLGVNALWITAPYEQIHGWVSGGSLGEFAHYAYHGYYPLDWTAMDRNFGTIEEFREFVDTAHSKGIRVVMDVVINHVGYGTLKDMATYGFGGTDAIENGATWDPTENGLSYIGMHGIIDYNSVDAWSNWWNKWVRAGLPGYTPAPPLATDEINGQLAYLPDIRTDLKTSVGLPPILMNKWKKEKTGFESWNLPRAAELRKDQNIAPADYLIRWLAAWVEEFGIDGFRADTAKHVEVWRWKQLKDAANTALKQWRIKNPNKPGAQWKDDFWMTAEVFGLGVGKNKYHTEGGFDSTINFKFQNEPSSINKIDATYLEYAEEINTDPQMNALSYISSHDTYLYDRDDLFNGGTALLMAPGGVQIYYGDETGRPFGPTGSDKDQGSRSAMNWKSYDPRLLAHWQKLGTFRNKHIAIGAGTHRKLADKPYTFARSFNKNGVKDQVIVAFGATGRVTVNTQGMFADGTWVRDHYSNRAARVASGKVTLQAAAGGIMLLEAFSGGPSISKLTVPSDVRFSNNVVGSTVTWRPVPNALRYNIYVNSERAGTATNQTSFTLNTAAWKKGETQQIEVSAVHPGGESLLSTVVSASVPRDVISITGKRIAINGKALPESVQPVNINGRMYLPFKSIFAPFGVNTVWNNDTKVLTAKRANYNLVLTMNAKSARLNGKSVSLDTPVINMKGTTYVPVRFVGQSLDAVIQYRAK